MAATTSSSGEFITFPGDSRSEVARTLAEPVPQALSLLDQFGLWGNLGVSLLGFVGAIFVLQPYGAGTPELSLAAGLTAIVLGTILGTLPVEPGSELSPDSGPVTVLLRPEQLEIVSAAPAQTGEPGCLAGRVVACDYYGHDAVVRVRPDDQHGPAEVIVRTTGGPQLPTGAPVLVRARGPVIAWARG